MIRFTRVTKEFPRTGMALRDVSFHVARGEFVFLTGPSGAGKSTILKLCYLDERPNDGEVRVAGMSSVAIRGSDVPKLRRKLGVIFQDFRLLEDRTVEANIGFALEVTGAPADSIAPKVARLLTQVGLASKATAYPPELSGGEQQRVAIARAIAKRPAVLLCDEPTGALDVATGIRVLESILHINETVGTTTLLITHNTDIARLGDRVVHFGDGTIRRIDVNATRVAAQDLHW